MSKIDFSTINKKAANSFHAQKKMLKKVMAGETVNCQECGTKLSLIPAKDGIAYVSCAPGCTKIELELDID